MKNFKHLLPRWPSEFGINQQDTYIFATFSGNTIELLQQLPATNSTLTFSCRHCSIKQLQSALFMDVPNIIRLDLSWNFIKSVELTSDTFRGPFGTIAYEPIALIDIDFSHNQFHTLGDNKLFEYTPRLKKLNLAYNQINILDRPTIAALESAKELEILDLSSNELQLLPVGSLLNLSRIQTINLAYNKLKVIPDSLRLLGGTLEILNFASNQITSFDQSSFNGLSSLKRLNISDMSTLKIIDNGTFANLTSLEYVYAGQNPNLEKFDLVGLFYSTNLTYLDISNCGLSTLTVPTPNTSNNPHSSSLSWIKLRTSKIFGNPWYCGCDLMQALEYIGGSHEQKLDDTAVARCDTPYILAGALFSNFTVMEICAMHIPKKYLIVDEDPPRFLRRRYIILTSIIASVVITFGLIIGFVVVCVRRRLKNEQYAAEPIRYTSVRRSNLSTAFAKPQYSNIHCNVQK